jgi:hypothetical protein
MLNRAVRRELERRELQRAVGAALGDPDVLEAAPGRFELVQVRS